MATTTPAPVAQQTSTPVPPERTTPSCAGARPPRRRPIDPDHTNQAPPAPAPMLEPAAEDPVEVLAAAVVAAHRWCDGKADTDLAQVLAKALTAAGDELGGVHHLTSHRPASLAAARLRHLATTYTWAPTVTREDW